MPTLKAIASDKVFDRFEDAAFPHPARKAAAFSRRAGLVRPR
jgi:hypothetical protein